MANDRLEKTLDALSFLSKEELEVVRDRVSFFAQLAKPGTKSRLEAEDEMLFYDSLEHSLSQVGAPPSGNYYMFRKTRLYPEFSKKVPDFAKFVSETFDRLSKLERRLVFGTGARVLIQNLQHRGLPVTLPVCISNMSSIPAFISQAFPGYAESGILQKALLDTVSLGVGHARN